MEILLTNDDGIYADGLRALINRFAQRHHVTVIAPDRQRSSVGHGITLHDPLRVEEIATNGNYHGYSVDGTPADCIKLGMMEIMPVLPDIVISGINPGANVGVNLNYSGTVAAAKEASLYGVPAIAVSIQGFNDVCYDAAACFIENLAKVVSRKGLPLGTCLNVNMPNIPPSACAGIRVSRQRTSQYPETFERRVDPRNRIYYWQSSDFQNHGENPDNDDGALVENYISITPVKCDMTDYTVLNDLKNWKIDV